MPTMLSAWSGHHVCGWVLELAHAGGRQNPYKKAFAGSIFAQPTSEFRSWVRLCKKLTCKALADFDAARQKNGR